MKKWLRDTSILSVLIMGTVPAWALVEPEILSSDPLAPPIMVPSWIPEALPAEIDPWVRRIVEARAAKEAGPGNALMESVAMQMLDRYEISDMTPEEQAGRLMSIASGEAAADYEKSHISEDAVRFSQDSFQGLGMQPQSTEESPDVSEKKTDTDAAFLAFLASPEGMKTLSMMSGDQISAIAALVSAMRSDLPPEQLFGRPASAMDGVPELSEDPSATDVAELVKSMTAPQSPVEPAVRDVGDGTNLLLSGWSARETEDGRVEIFNETIEGSALTVVEDMVIGPFGPVQSIERSTTGIQVSFANGEVIRSQDSLLGEGVPVLSGTEAQEATAWEFMLSALPDMPEAPLAQASSEEEAAGSETSQDAVTESVTAPASSLRPKPRPEGLVENAPSSPSELGTDGSPRPKPRPENLVVAAAPQEGSEGAMTRSLRPRPRPASLSPQKGGT